MATNSNITTGASTTTQFGHSSAIRAKKVLGTHVKNASGEKLGLIEDIVLDKLSNNIMFAVCGFGGFLGMGEKHHAIPWRLLKYDKNQDGYVVNLTEAQLKAAPADTIAELMRGDATAFRDRAYEYYKEPKYW